MYIQDPRLRLRIATENDCKSLWEWTNDPIVRAASFSSAPISWEDHLEWFTDKLNSSNSYIFIAIDTEEQSIGQIRFDINLHDQATISISIRDRERNKGYGKLILKLAIVEILKHRYISQINAFVKPDNIPSIKLFENTGFQNVSLDSNIANNLAFQYDCKSINSDFLFT